jgi:dUTP pyrophosphatase
MSFTKNISVRMKVKVKKLNEKAVIPAYAHKDGDMGMDVTAISYEYDPVYDRYIYHTGLAFEVPKGYGMLIFPRSSNCKTEAYLCNSVGVLDSNYRGELMFMFKNRTRSEDAIVRKPDKDRYLMQLEVENELAPYKVGDRVGQIIIIPYPEIEFDEVDELSDTERGEGGFGSTNK